ncbi:hypothetical protein GCM10010145_02490 [Streptomyces ruber]|uniref:Uncharacterized protein n=2 Tax=Streptomyces TaxID=1883 RepID=A0A918B6M6_9ACTN|nr:DUF6082 family protein [Streptomyces ruber]GGQ38638.1 hypothetical protein GCM10010145_02490 [Streptomyces ruber]
MTDSGTVKALGATATIIVICCAASIALTLALVQIPALRSAESGNAGQALGAASGATSVVALIYLARTFHHQREEMRRQREMLASQQDEILAQRQAELVALREDARINNECALKIAESAVRSQHHALTSMAISDPSLADVWPPYSADISVDTRKQFMYANQIISFQCMAYTLGVFNCDEAEALMHYLFESVPMRTFWEASRAGRSAATPHGGKMQKFYELAENAYQRRCNEQSQD